MGPASSLCHNSNSQTVQPIKCRQWGWAMSVRSNRTVLALRRASILAWACGNRCIKLSARAVAGAVSQRLKAELLTQRQHGRSGSCQVSCRTQWEGKQQRQQVFSSGQFCYEVLGFLPENEPEVWFASLPSNFEIVEYALNKLSFCLISHSHYLLIATRNPDKHFILGWGYHKDLQMAFLSKFFCLKVVSGFIRQWGVGRGQLHVNDGMASTTPLIQTTAPG